MLKAVLDTNIFISSLLNKKGASAKVPDMWNVEIPYSRLSIQAGETVRHNCWGCRRKPYIRRVAQQGLAFWKLEPYDGKLSRRVLGGKGVVTPLTYPVS